MSNEIGLKFDSSTYIYYKNEKIGKLRLPFRHEKPNIQVTLVYKDFVECYLDAEVFVTKYLIQNKLITVEV